MEVCILHRLPRRADGNHINRKWVQLVSYEVMQFLGANNEVAVCCGTFYLFLQISLRYFNMVNAPTRMLEQVCWSSIFGTLRLHTRQHKLETNIRLKRTCFIAVISITAPGFFRRIHTTYPAHTPQNRCKSRLTFRNLASHIQDGRKITLQMPHFIFIQQISVLNILNMLNNLHFSSSKCLYFMKLPCLVSVLLTF